MEPVERYFFDIKLHTDQLLYHLNEAPYSAVFHFGVHPEFETHLILPGLIKIWKELCF